MAVYKFSTFTLHTGRFELCEGDTNVPLPRVPMEILIALVRRRGELLTRRQIATVLWPNSDPEDVVPNIGRGGRRQGTRYALINSMANVALTYMIAVEGAVAGKHGPRTAAAVDGTCGIIVALMAVVLHYALRSRRHGPTNSD